MAEWSLLPTPLVDAVAGLLCMADQTRMAAVCKPWQEAMADGLCRRRPAPSVWLLLPHCSEKGKHDDRCECPSFSEGMNRSYIFSLPSEKVRVIGSSRGWLMLEDEISRLQAFHPITKTCTMFPPSGRRHRHSFDAIQKAVIVTQREGRRGGRERPALVAVLRRRTSGRQAASELAFVAAGDDVWTDLPVPAGSHFDDIATHDGKLYALGDTSQVLVFDVGGERSSSSPATATVIDLEPDHNPYCVKHLGVISGELILVRWWICTACPFRRRRCLPEFEVLRLQTGQGHQSKWVETKDLDGHAILLGYDGIIALPAEEFRELKANCIYSVEGDGSYSEAGLTVMNVASRAVSFEPLSFPSSSSLFWFLPNPGDF